MGLKVIAVPTYSLQDMFDGKVPIGAYIEYENRLVKFKGWDFGTYPIATDAENGEQVKLPSY